MKGRSAADALDCNAVYEIATLNVSTHMTGKETRRVMYHAGVPEPADFNAGMDRSPKGDMFYRFFWKGVVLEFW